MPSTPIDWAIPETDERAKPLLILLLRFRMRGPVDLLAKSREMIM